MEKLPAPNKLSVFFYTLKSKWLTFWLSLTLPQKLYFSAVILFISFFFNDAPTQNDEQIEHFVLNGELDFGGGLFLFLVLAALIIELWPKIVKFWEHTLGKAVAFVFYAFLANYALAHAAGIINDITGVSAEHFPYTHNLSLMLSIPTWFMLSTFMVLVIIPLLQPFYIVTLLLLRPFGLHKLWHAPDYRFPITTSLIRMILCMMLSISLILFTISSGMAGGMNSLFKAVVQNFTQTEVHIGMVRDSQPITTPEELVNAPSSTTQDIVNTSLTAMQEDTTAPGFTVKATKGDMVVDIENESKKRVENYDRHIKQILAYFIYELEADSYSRCQVTPGRRVIELNTYEILEIWPVADKKKEYHFEVKPCISPGLERILKPLAQ